MFQGHFNNKHLNLSLEGRVVVALGDDAGLDAVLLELVTPGQGPGQSRGRVKAGAGARGQAGAAHHQLEAVPGAACLLLGGRQLGQTRRPGKAGNLHRNIEMLKRLDNSDTRSKPLV